MKKITNKSKTVLVWIIAALMLFSLTGCEKYSSKYHAVGFVHSNDTTSAFMNFYSFNGRMVFKLKSSGEGDLKYTAKLESGHATVYYDFRGTKSELFSVVGGDEITSHGGYVEAGKVYVIVETDGKCLNGEFRFSLE